MKRKRSMIVGAACGIACALCVGAYIMQVDEQAAAVRAEALERYGGDQIEVCVAKRDIAPGETLTEGSVETRMWVAALLPEGAVTDRTEAVGKVAGTSVLAGEVILDRRFDARTSSLDVPQGFAAVSVPAREVQAVGGALAAGMSVDVYAIGAGSAERILVGADVLATSVTESGNAGSSMGIAWATLAVAPEKVRELIAAAENLELYFVLPAYEESGQAIDPESLRSRALEQRDSATTSGEGAFDVEEEADREDEAARTAPTKDDASAGSTGERGEGTSWIR